MRAMPSRESAHSERPVRMRGDRRGSAPGPGDSHAYLKQGCARAEALLTCPCQSHQLPAQRGGCLLLLLLHLKGCNGRRPKHAVHDSHHAKYAMLCSLRSHNKARQRTGATQICVETRAR